MQEQEILNVKRFLQNLYDQYSIILLATPNRDLLRNQWYYSGVVDDMNFTRLCLIWNDFIHWYNYVKEYQKYKVELTPFSMPYFGMSGFYGQPYRLIVQNSIDFRGINYIPVIVNIEEEYCDEYNFLCLLE